MVKPNLSVGDTVLYSKYAGVEFEVSLKYDQLHFQCPLPMSLTLLQCTKAGFRHVLPAMGMLRM